jgi:glutamine amidotransferase
MKLVIVDIGGGNTGSVGIACERFGVQPVISGDAEEISSADRVILPGVAAAGFAMERIEALGLKRMLRALRQPVLGICLGMQLLFDHSEEADTPCLGVIAGAVRKLKPGPNRPVPHMGWSKLEVRDDNMGLRQGDYVYFANSFACEDGPYVAANVDYGETIIPAVVRQANFIGAQFHPERSSEAGARFLEAFWAS